MRKIVRNRSCREIKQEMNAAHENSRKAFAAYQIMSDGESGCLDALCKYTNLLADYLVLAKEFLNAGCRRKK